MAENDSPNSASTRSGRAAAARSITCTFDLATSTIASCAGANASMITMCPRGDSHLTSMPSLTGELVLGGLQ